MDYIARSMRVNANLESGHCVIWGFDYKLADYKFRNNIELQQIHIEVHPSGKISSKRNKGLSEVLAGEMLVKSPHECCLLSQETDDY